MWSRLHWSVKSKLKNEYKTLLKDWFLDEDDKLPKEIHFDIQPIYKDKRRRDAINVALMHKTLEDSIVELGSLEDDNQTSVTIHQMRVDKTLNQHVLKIKIFER